MPRVLVTPVVAGGLPGPYQEILKAAGFEVIHRPPDAKLTDPAVFKSLLSGVDATLASVEPYTEEVFSGSRLRAVARLGVGYDAVDLTAATKHGVAVTITPGTNEHSVAETTIALITGVFRGFPGRLDEVRTGQWVRKTLPRLAGRTIGILGLGRIGRAVVPRAIGLGLRVMAFDPYADRAFCEKHGVDLGSLDDVLTRADIVSLHLPSTAETAHLINEKSLARMKPGSVLINTARGSLVDERALIAALESGHLLGAGLDVFEVEPLPTSSPLLKFPNVLVSPHAAGVDHASLEAMATVAAECVVNLYQNRWPDECVVNREVKERWKW